MVELVWTIILRDPTRKKIQNLWPKYFDKLQPEPNQKHIYRTIHFFLKMVHFLVCFLELFL
ncbi:hypothetical protein Gotur_012376 [Gossypium turneri]